MKLDVTPPLFSSILHPDVGWCCVDAKTLDLIETLCKSAGYLLLRLDGQTPTARRMEIVERFNSRHSPECMQLVYRLLFVTFSYT